MSSPSTRSVPLTATQHEVLSAAAARSDGALILPARLKGRAAQTLAQALLSKGHVREIRAKGDQPVWRKDADTGRSFTLVLSKAGRLVVAATEPAPADDTHRDPMAPVASTAPATAPPSAPPAVDEPRSGTKLAAVIALLARTEGTSITELMTATGWLPHTTRAALSGLRKRGYALMRDSTEAGAIYRIASSPGTTA